MKGRKLGFKTEGSYGRKEMPIEVFSRDALVSSYVHKQKYVRCFNVLFFWNLRGGRAMTSLRLG